MPSFCVVMGCSRRAERDRGRFFRIPKTFNNRGERLDALSAERRESWVRALNRGNLSETFLKNARICENHFVSGEPAKLEDKDHPDWVPSVNMGYFTIKVQNKQSLNRHVRSDECHSKRFKTDEMSEAGSASIDVEPRAGPSTKSAEFSEQYNEQEGRQSTIQDAATQTDLDMNNLNKMFKDLYFANQRIQSLEEKVKAFSLSEETFRDNDFKTLYLQDSRES
ncbi:hypothetical protein NQ315_012070 [Exocentrus adspersus]|uniref:THAP-type domain-containing protein n=1 Tax=Exocentrus adspersus TaxID=1586481 RepID=A0AAV8VZ39_9CUCU|nr:hypothetical protein NQ315_012070 [Exocentrus adspersus]